MFIGETIGDAYKEWQDGSTIFISSQTGSGKTTFILQELLLHAKEQNKRILYLVNRRVLKEQMEKAILDLPSELYGYIKVELYQNIEKQYMEASAYPYPHMGLKIPDIIYAKYDRKYDYIVCDEAHYFLMDSNYNTKTILSYKFVRKLMGHHTCIFMSATIDAICEYIKTTDEAGFTYCTNWYNYMPSIRNEFSKRKRYKKYLCYSQDIKYDYIDVSVIYDLQKIEELIVAETAKWLVFVDNRKFGNDLKKDILEISKEKKKEITVSFVTADYLSDDEAKSEVDNIVLGKKQSAKVLIATSVLDNGINIKDLELRNILILADTKTEFLQMLGRKRQDGEKVKLYIYRQDKNHFMQRKRIANNRKKIAANIYGSFTEGIMQQIREGILRTDQSIYEKKNIEYNSKKIIDKLSNGQINIDDIKALFLSINGVFCLNMLSMRNVDNLSQFYDKMIHQFETDGEDAFVKEQLRWLGKTEEEIEEILKDSKKTYYDKCRDKVIEEFKRKVNIPLSKAEIIQLKNSIQTELKELVEHVGEKHDDYQKYIDLIRKNDRPISDKFMDFLREQCKIPFTMHVQKGENGVYTIKNFQK